VTNTDLYTDVLNYLSEKFGFEVFAALAYGSRIAGYASKHSDYDLIIVVDGFKEGIRYIYEKVFDGNYVSALVVDKKFFEEDIFEARHGEFVAGRLFTVYEPIVNGEYVSEMDYFLKRRTILEEAYFLIDEFGDFAYEFVIPIKYFLFSRLRRRVKAYPPVRYSYVKMFFGDNGPENQDSVLRGFKRAIDDLVSEGVFEWFSGGVSIVRRPKIDMGFLPPKIMFLKRSAKHYITHGRSAKVKPIVVLEETFSKLRREMEKISMPDELVCPESLLGLKSGPFYYNPISLERAVKMLFGEKYDISDIIKYGVFSELYRIRVVDGGERSFILKRYTILYIIKWLLIQLWLLDVKRFILSPKGRLVNEYRMLYKFSTLGFKCPRPLLVSWKGKSLFMDYIDGYRLVDITYPDLIYQIYRELGRALGFLHSMNITLGDVKPHNIIVKDSGWYIVDLEQARFDDNYAWDIAEALFYTFIWLSPLNKYSLEDMCMNFVEGYLEYGDAENITKAVSWKYIRPFLPLVSIFKLYRIRKLIKDMIGNRSLVTR
jgi:Kae1-associated kinase Bud32